MRNPIVPHSLRPASCPDCDVRRPPGRPGRIAAAAHLAHTRAGAAATGRRCAAARRRHRQRGPGARAIRAPPARARPCGGCYFLSKSPANANATRPGFRYLRSAAFTLAASASRSPHRRRRLGRAVEVGLLHQRAGEAAILRAVERRSSSSARFAAFTSASVKPSLSARSNSSSNPARTRARFSRREDRVDADRAAGRRCCPAEERARAVRQAVLLAQPRREARLGRPAEDEARDQQRRIVGARGR